MFAVLAALPLMAQDAAPAQNACCPMPDCAYAENRPCLPCCPKGPRFSPEKKAEFLAKWDADKDGKLSCEEKKALHEAMKANFEKRMLERWDADKDGRLSDEEKAAAKAEWDKKRAERKCGRRGHGPKGPRFSPEKKAEFLAKWDADKDGKLSCEEKKALHEAMKANFEKKMLERWDADKDGRLSDEEKAAAKAEWDKKRAERKCGRRGHGPKRGCCPPPACCPKAAK